jgi:FAD/FMN-containing dehydrogenase
MATRRQATSTSFEDLAGLLTGHLILPDDPAYDQTRALWNGRATTRPAAIARCASAQDISHAIHWARGRRLPLSVRAGGHDYAGRALCQDGIVLDLSALRGVSVDPVARMARIQGGATAGDLISVAHRVGLGTTTGTVDGVGMAGLTLGGGYGPLCGAYGLVADNLLSAQVVTADGQLVATSETDNPDLFWGLRGGGGNFGVVVSSEYRLHPVTTVLSGLLLYPLDQARAALRFYGEFIKNVPDEVTIQPGFIQLPDGPPVLFISPTYCGPLDQGERVLAPLRTFGKPLADQIQPIAYDALLTTLNPLFPIGRSYYIQTQSLDGLRIETIDALVDHARRLTSPLSAISIHHFHGAASRVAAAKTAFALRRGHLMVEIVAAWEPVAAAEEQQHLAWAKELSRALAPYAFEGGYINLLDIGETERVRAAFGPNYERLLALKRKYDPGNLFRSTIGHVAPSTS